MIVSIPFGSRPNRKLGAGVSATYRRVGSAENGAGTCPASCPLMGRGCYAQRGRAALHSFRAGDVAHSLFRALSGKRPPLAVRLNVTGDFFTPCHDGTASLTVDLNYWQEVISFCKQNPSIPVWGYTHDLPALLSQTGINHSDDLPANLTIIFSSTSEDDEKFAGERGFRYARVSETTDRKPGEIYCPVDRAKHFNHETSITCQTCQLCFNLQKQVNILFLKR